MKTLVVNDETTKGGWRLLGALRRIQRAPRRFAALSLAVVAGFSFNACETPGQTALLGAATGAAIGGAHGGGRDALRGAAIGAGAGYVAGRVVQHERDRAYSDGYYRGRGERRYSRNRYYYYD